MAKSTLNRRQFLSLVAAGVAAETLLPLCEPMLAAELQDEVHLKKRYVRQNKSYGSGNFGEWIDDAHGLPCYHYTCNQAEDPAALTPVEAAWRSPTDHTHQVGNDRITAAVSNYGYLQVRQDESGPKFLNDHHPEEGLYGAGIGYLTDGVELLATHFPGTGTSLDRFFGMGYLRKQAVGTNFSIDQTIFAPFGDDPVLLSEVTITSQSPKATNLHWVEYWGVQVYPFSYEAFIEGGTTASRTAASQPDPEQVVKLRRNLARRFSHSYERVEGALIESKRLDAARVQPSQQAMQEESLDRLASTERKMAGTDGPSLSSSGANSIAADVPPETFLAPLDEGPVRFLTNSAAFFGDTGVLHPAALVNVAPGNGIPQEIAPDDLTGTGPEGALILDKPFILEAGQAVTLRFLYGYLPAGFTAPRLIAKYRASADGLLAKTAASWKTEGIQFAVTDDSKSGPWVERESRWHNYYLRSGFTYDEFFNEHILSQGQVYQYCMGIQGAARDPLQHGLPLVFGESDLAKQVLRYALKSQQADGSLPYAITGDGQIVPNAAPPSDLDLWLLWLASEYILATRDTAFLEERLTTYPFHAGSPGGGPSHTVREKLDRAYRHLTETIGTGKHGLVRGLNADWNDQIFFREIPENLRDEVGRESESVMNAAMAAYVLDHYARMLRYSGDANAATEAANYAEQQRQAVSAQWAGKWFKRLWRGPTAGWLGGEDRLWLDGQPWAILGGCATPEQQKSLVQSIDELLRKPSKIGAKQVGNPNRKPIDWPGVMPGETKNGGVYDTLDGPLIWALAGIDPAVAFDEWKKNTRAHHTEVYPYTWYGIWSGPDVYCSADSDHAGQTGYDWGIIDSEARRRPNSYRGLSWTAWPVMNMHRHAWPLYSAAKLLGIEFTEAGLNLAPSIPRPEYSFRSRLVGVEKNAQGYQGWYAPKKEGNWTIRLKLLSEELSSLKKLIVNGTSQPVEVQQGGVLQFVGSSAPETAIRWSLLKG